MSTLPSVGIVPEGMRRGLGRFSGFPASGKAALLGSGIVSSNRRVCAESAYFRRFRHFGGCPTYSANCSAVTNHTLYREQNAILGLTLG